MVAVGYMDPATGRPMKPAVRSSAIHSYPSADLQHDGDSVAASGAKLGIVTGRDSAQACRDHYSPTASFLLRVLCEIAIAAWAIWRK